MPSSVKRVLDCPDFLELVFDFLDQADLLNVAMTSKQYTSLALRRRWRTVRRLRHLFSVLPEGLFESRRGSPVSRTFDCGG